MIKIKSIAGNIFHDNKKFESLKEDEFEKLEISRSDLEKTRIRTKTNNGTDLAICLENETTLHNGDVIDVDNGEKTILVSQLQEKVIAVKINAKHSPELLVLLGHIIGNRHRPISIQDDVVFFPIQADSELEVFERLFSEIIDHIELSIQDRVFNANTGANVHDHG